MIVRYAPRRSRLTVYDVRPGVVFKTEEGRVLLRVADGIQVADGSDLSCGNDNTAVCVSSGRLVYLSKDTRVEPFPKAVLDLLADGFEKDC